MSRILLIGTGNLHKFGELSELLQGVPWELKALGDFDQISEPVEDGETFEVNALIKARYFSKHFDICCVADDSGLQVDALDGAPGIYSARYAGEGCTYKDNNAKLLDALDGNPVRSARFVCCAAFVNPNGQHHVETGTIEGAITEECRGDEGFGYDPMFLPAGQDATFAEMPSEKKQAISHRAKAFQKMKTYLET